MAFDKNIKRFDPSRTMGTRTNERIAEQKAYWTRDKQGRRLGIGDSMAPIPMSTHDAETLDLDAIFLESYMRCCMRIAASTERMRDQMAEEGPFIRASDLTLEEIRK